MSAFLSAQETEDRKHPAIASKTDSDLSSLAGLWNGKGELLLAGGETYFGDWKEGVKHGHGTLTGKYGPLYEGEYKEGQRWGWGTGTYASGERYEGEWERDERHGQGTLYRVSAATALLLLERAASHRDSHTLFSASVSVCVSVLAVCVFIQLEDAFCGVLVEACTRQCSCLLGVDSALTC